VETPTPPSTDPSTQSYPVGTERVGAGAAYRHRWVLAAGAILVVALLAAVLVLATGTSRAVMPGVVGQQVADAFAAVEESGLCVAEVRFTDRGDSPAGTVLAQGPPARDDVRADQFVRLTVSGAQDASLVELPGACETLTERFAPA
jgi:hypothetical protein